MQSSSWWRDTGKLYVRYLIAVAASVPASVAYAYLELHRLDSWWIEASLLVVGLGLATAGWRWSEYLFAPSRKIVELESQTSNAGANSLGMRVATGTLAASFMIVGWVPSLTESFAGQANNVCVIAQVDAAGSLTVTVIAEMP